MSSRCCHDWASTESIARLIHQAALNAGMTTLTSSAISQLAQHRGDSRDDALDGRTVMQFPFILLWRPLHNAHRATGQGRTTLAHRLRERQLEPLEELLKRRYG